MSRSTPDAPIPDGDGPAPHWLATALDQARSLMRDLHDEIVVELSDATYDADDALTRVVLGAAAVAHRFARAAGQVRHFVARFARAALDPTRDAELARAVVARSIAVVDAAYMSLGPAAFCTDPELVVATLRAARQRPEGASGR